MATDPQGTAAEGAGSAVDPLTPLRDADRQARAVARATVVGALAGMALAATIPLWSDEERLRPILAGSDVRQSVLWAWDIAPHDAWWAFGLVLLVPSVMAVVGAVVTRRRLTRAAAARPFQRSLAISAPGPVATTATVTGPGRLTDAQRRARERGRQDGLATQQRHVVAQTRRRVSVWTHLGGAFALVMAVWFGVALAVSALGLQSTPMGVAVGVASWWIVLVPLALWVALGAARRALVGRRARASALSSP